MTFFMTIIFRTGHITGFLAHSFYGGNGEKYYNSTSWNIICNYLPNQSSIYQLIVFDSTEARHMMI